MAFIAQSFLTFSKQVLDVTALCGDKFIANSRGNASIFNIDGSFVGYLGYFEYEDRYYYKNTDGSETITYSWPYISEWVPITINSSTNDPTNLWSYYSPNTTTTYVFNTDITINRTSSGHTYSPTFSGSTGNIRPMTSQYSKNPAIGIDKTRTINPETINPNKGSLALTPKINYYDIFSSHKSGYTIIACKFPIFN